MSNYNTAYDDVFRTMLVDCKELIIPVVGETFHENFTGKEQVILKENEIYLRQQGSDEEKKITDSSFAIVTMSGCIKNYHLECQSTPDGSISYKVPALKVKSYDIETIFKKKLYFLIPFYVFIFEEKFETINEDDECLAQLKAYTELVQEGVLTIDDAAKRAGLSVEEFEKKMEEV